MTTDTKSEISTSDDISARLTGIEHQLSEITAMLIRLTYATSGDDREEKAPRKKQQRFIPPTVREVEDYCTEKRFHNISPEMFVTFYEAKGWLIGKNKMKSWQAAVRQWDVRDREESGYYSTTTSEQF